MLRSLELDKAILLEGNQCVGKSSMVQFLSELTNNKLLKVTLSEQTDIIDLLGSDMPCTEEETAEGSYTTAK